MLERLRGLADRNEVFTSLIGLGYHDTITPPVILRNVLENPAWYTAYTPYQPEISQGRLEALLNFQTMVADLTAMDLANASLLDEGTAAAEAMAMLHRLNPKGGTQFFVDADCLPQTIAVVATRAEPLGIEVVVGDPDTPISPATGVFGLLLQYPGASGRVRDDRGADRARARARRARRGCGRPARAHTARRRRGRWAPTRSSAARNGSACRSASAGRTRRSSRPRDEYKRTLPGRLVGVSVDRAGRTAFRLALQTRRATHPAGEGDEQHLHRASAPRGDRRFVRVVPRTRGPPRDRDARARQRRRARGRSCARPASRWCTTSFFDTLTVRVPGRGAELAAAARDRRINLREVDADTLGIALDETTTARTLATVCEIFGAELDASGGDALPRRAWCGRLTT